MAIEAPGPYHLSLSEDGTRICVRDTHGDVVAGREADIFLGYLNEADAAAIRPTIESVFLNPAEFSRSDPDATGVIEVTVSDPSGLEGVWVNARTFLNGMSAGSDEVPVKLNSSSLSDNGSGVDTVAGDGIYSQETQAADSITDLTDVDGAVFRVQVYDGDGNEWFGEVTVRVTD